MSMTNAQHDSTSPNTFQDKYKQEYDARKRDWVKTHPHTIHNGQQIQSENWPKKNVAEHIHDETKRALIEGLSLEKILEIEDELWNS